MSRSVASRPRFFENCGESWNRPAPVFGDSALSRVSINSIEFAHASPSRFQWVMNLDAFHANRKSRGGGRRLEGFRDFRQKQARATSRLVLGTAGVPLQTPTKPNAGPRARAETFPCE